MKIIGIDPGTNRIGYAMLDGNHHSARLLSAETITIPTQVTSIKKLVLIEKALRERLQRDQPDALAIEKIFFAKNAKTALAVAEARGVILLTAHHHVRSIWEYTPLEIKIAVSGYGRADKAQVRKMIHMLFKDAAMPPGDDAIDAIATAFTGLARAGR